MLTKIITIISFSLLISMAEGCNFLCPSVNTIKTDTLVINKWRDSIVIQKKVDTFAIKDTLIQIRPFGFRIDTVIKTIYKNKIKYDTITLSYRLDSNIAKIGIKSTPDSSITITKENTIIKERSFFQSLEDWWVWYLMGIITGVSLIIFLQLKGK